MALQTAITDRNLSKAIAYTNESIECRADCSVSLQLLTILLSAHESHSKALQIVRMGLKEFPECLNLYYIKASLQLGLEGAEVSIQKLNLFPLFLNLKYHLIRNPCMWEILKIFVFFFSFLDSGEIQ